jgi:hypothetical protein
MERKVSLIAAKSAAQKAKSLLGKASYNLACIHALLGEKDKALDELEACDKDGTLPSREELHEDCDLASLRKTKRFKALLG